MHYDGCLATGNSTESRRSAGSSPAGWLEATTAAVGRKQAAEEARITIAGLLGNSMVDLEAETKEPDGDL
jgi:hypothetical protein